jgi:hypothetical protein
MGYKEEENYSEDDEHRYDPIVHKYHLIIHMELIQNNYQQWKYMHPYYQNMDIINIDNHYLLNIYTDKMQTC